jgi:hypothetical protein
MAIKLLARGETSLVILEKDTEIGGTWRDNSYPGAECDVQSHLYSYSFAPKPDWTQRYAGWLEIQHYILDVAQRYGVRPFVRFGQRVNGARFDAGTGRWQLRRRKACMLHATSCSRLAHCVPRRCRLEHKGRVFHSARWDLLRFHRQRSRQWNRGSAINVEDCTGCRQLDVYQRTPAWVIPRDTRFTAQRAPSVLRYWLRRLPSPIWTNESRVVRFILGWLVACSDSLGSTSNGRSAIGAGTNTGLHDRLQARVDSTTGINVQSLDVALVAQGIRGEQREIVTADGVAHHRLIILGTASWSIRGFTAGLSAIGLEGCSDQAGVPARKRTGRPSRLSNLRNSWAQRRWDCRSFS